MQLNHITQLLKSVELAQMKLYLRNNISKYVNQLLNLLRDIKMQEKSLHLVNYHSYWVLIQVMLKSGLLKQLVMGLLRRILIKLLKKLI